jgi:hypothetical protein
MSLKPLSKPPLDEFITTCTPLAIICKFVPEKYFTLMPRPQVEG